MHLLANFGQNLTCAKFLALLMRLLKIPEVWDLLYYVFFLETQGKMVTKLPW